MTKSAAEVEMEVEASRGQLDRTMEALKDKMTPGQLFDEASHAMGDVGQQILSKFMEQAKENPMPLAVMGAGLVWLMAGSKKTTTSGSASWIPSSSSGSSSTGSGLKDKIQHLGDKAGDVLSQAKDAVTDKVGSAQDSASGALHDMGGRASDLSDQAMNGAKQLMNREPLLLAAVGLVIGVGLAAALPSTSIEDQTVGSMRDDLLEKGKSLASDSVDKVTDTAQAAFGAVKSELANSGEGGSDLSQRVESAAHAGVQAGKDQLSQS